jgi:hypothetical protein
LPLRREHGSGFKVGIFIEEVLALDPFDPLGGCGGCLCKLLVPALIDKDCLKLLTFAVSSS